MIPDCPHGMPSPASCVQCMQDGPVVEPTPADTQMLTADRWMTARFATRCGRNRAHLIDPGDQIGFHVDLGWCCGMCVR